MKIGVVLPNWSVLLRFMVKTRDAVSWTVRSDRRGWRVGSKLEFEAVNSEHLKNPKKARRNIASSVELVKAPE